MNRSRLAFFKINIASLAAKVNNTCGLHIAFESGFHNLNYMNGVSILEICSKANQFVCANYLVDNIIEENKEQSYSEFMYCMGHGSESISNLLTKYLFRESIIHEQVPSPVKGKIINNHFFSEHRMIN